MTIRAQVLEVLQELTGWDPEDLEELDDNAHLLEDLGIDSLDAVELELALEDRFELVLDVEPDWIFDRAPTVGSLIQYVEDARC